MKEKMKAVVIDDNADFLFTMETFLSRNGYEAFTAEDGQKGLDLIKKEKPDVILLDVMMETLFSGFEVCNAVRMDDQLKETPIIGISGMSDELRIDYKQYHDYEYFKPDAFLTKPVDKDKLLVLMKETIENVKSGKGRVAWHKDLVSFQEQGKSLD